MQALSKTMCARKLTRTRTLVDDELITILAGQMPTPFKVQRTLLASASAWFRAAVSGRFKEGQERILRLPDVDSAVVEDFLYWLYHNRVDIGWKGDEKHMDEAELLELRTKRCVHAIRVWAFGDVYFLANLQNHVMQELHTNFIDHFPSVEVIRAGYELTPPGSFVRRLIMDEIKEGLHHRAQLAGDHGKADCGYYAHQFDALGAIPGFTVDLANALTNEMKELLAYATIAENGKEHYYVPDDTHCTHE